MNTLKNLSAALFVGLPLLASAQTNPAYIEKSLIIGAGNEIKLFGLPGKSTAGPIKYWDTTITVEIDAAGKPMVSSVTTSVPQAKANSTRFVPGTYSGGGATCTLLNSPFIGRTQYDLQCTRGNDQFTATWFSGLIAGHPWEEDLVAAQLDTLVGNKEYSWGKTVFDDNSSTTFFACFNDPELLSARQVGNTLTLVNYGVDKIVVCQTTFNKLP